MNINNFFFFWFRSFCFGFSRVYRVFHSPTKKEKSSPSRHKKGGNRIIFFPLPPPTKKKKYEKRKRNDDGHQRPDNTRRGGRKRRTHSDTRRNEKLHQREENVHLTDGSKKKPQKKEPTPPVDGRGRSESEKRTVRRKNTWIYKHKESVLKRKKQTLSRINYLHH